MTVTADYSPEFFGLADSYTFGFECVGSQAIEVYEVGTDGIAHLLPANNYNLIKLKGRRPIFDGGTIVVNTYVIENLEYIKIVRNTPIDQTVDWKTVEKFPLVMIEYSLDKLTMILQELTNRLCNDPEGIAPVTSITQTIAFDDYTTFPAGDVNFALDKLYTICQEIVANKQMDPLMPFYQGNP